MTWTQKEIEACIVNCKKKAAVDADFRKKLLGDPAAAVKEISGKEIPAGFKKTILRTMRPLFFRRWFRGIFPTRNWMKSPPESAVCRPVQWMRAVPPETVRNKTVEISSGTE